MEIIGRDKEDMELITFECTKDELKMFEDAFEIEKQRRDSNYEFEDFTGEVIMLSAYHNLQETKDNEIMAKFKEIEDIHKEIDKLRDERQDAFEKEIELMNKIESERIN